MSELDVAVGHLEQRLFDAVAARRSRGGRPSAPNARGSSRSPRRGRCTAMATWSISVSSMSPVIGADQRPEAVIWSSPTCSRSSGSSMPRPSVGRQAEHADLALVQVVVHLVGGLAGLARAGTPADRIGWIMPLADQPVGLPRLLVVGEVAADRAASASSRGGGCRTRSCSRSSPRT